MKSGAAPVTENDQLITLVYVSSSVQPLSEGQLVEILRASRTNNARLGITGVLLYEDGNLIQALEGPRQAVHQLVNKIRKDPRHTGYMQLIERPITARRFGAWSMGFKRLSELTLEDREVFTSYLEEGDNWHPFSSGDDAEKGKSAPAYVLLKSFKKSCGPVSVPA